MKACASTASRSPKPKALKTLPERQQVILRVLALGAMLGLSSLAFVIRDQLQNFRSLGYLGAFLVAFFSNASILLPIPGIWFVFASGSIFHPLGIALAAATGGALGELSGYLAGFSGQGLAERVDVFQRTMPFVQRYGIFGIILLAAIPNPFFDLAGIAAGMLKIPLWKFLLATWIGQLIKMLSLAYAGSISLNWIFGT